MQKEEQNDGTQCLTSEAPYKSFVPPVLDRGHHLTLRGAVARQLVRDHDTRGRICRFSSLRSRRLAAFLSRRLWTRTSSTKPSWSTARQSQCFVPLIIRHTWRVARGSLTPTRSQNRT